MRVEPSGSKNGFLSYFRAFYLNILHDSGQLACFFTRSEHIRGLQIFGYEMLAASRAGEHKKSNARVFSRAFFRAKHARDKPIIIIIIRRK